jgi:hypothetical protein
MLLAPELYDFDQWFMLLFVVFHGLSTVNFNEFSCVLESQALAGEDFGKFREKLGLGWNLYFFVHFSNRFKRARQGVNAVR